MLRRGPKRRDFISSRTSRLRHGIRKNHGGATRGKVARLDRLKNWLSQDIRKVGENYLNEGERKFHLNNEDSAIVFLDDTERVFIHIAYTCPFEYGMSGATGFRYDAIKDFIRWNSDTNYETDEIYQEHIETFLKLGSFFAGELSKHMKNNRN